MLKLCRIQPAPRHVIPSNSDVKLKECWMENFSSKVHFVPSWGSCGLKRVTFVGLFHSNSRSSICSKHRHLLNLVSVFYFKTWRSPIHLKSQSFADSLGHEHLFYSCSHHTWAIKWLNFMIRWLITFQKSVMNFPNWLLYPKVIKLLVRDPRSVGHGPKLVLCWTGKFPQNSGTDPGLRKFTLHLWLHVGDGYWWRYVFATISRYWWRFQPFSSPILSIF